MSERRSLVEFQTVLCIERRRVSLKAVLPLASVIGGGGGIIGLKGERRMHGEGDPISFRQEFERQVVWLEELALFESENRSAY